LSVVVVVVCLFFRVLTGDFWCGLFVVVGGRACFSAALYRVHRAVVTLFFGSAFLYRIPHYAAAIAFCLCRRTIVPRLYLHATALPLLQRVARAVCCRAFTCLPCRLVLPVRVTRLVPACCHVTPLPPLLRTSAASSRLLFIAIPLPLSVPPLACCAITILPVTPCSFCNITPYYYHILLCHTVHLYIYSFLLPHLHYVHTFTWDATTTRVRCVRAAAPAYARLLPRRAALLPRVRCARRLRTVVVYRTRTERTGGRHYAPPSSRLPDGSVPLRLVGTGWFLPGVGGRQLGARLRRTCLPAFLWFFSFPHLLSYTLPPAFSGSAAAMVRLPVVDVVRYRLLISFVPATCTHATATSC
jgi:hypothetical protein